MENNDWEKLLFDKPVKCAICGGMLEYLGIGEYRCAECGEETLDDYGKVREFLEEHAIAPVFEIARETGVSRDKVKMILKRGEEEPKEKSASLPQKPYPQKQVAFGNYLKNR